MNSIKYEVYIYIYNYIIYICMYDIYILYTIYIMYVIIYIYSMHILIYYFVYVYVCVCIQTYLSQITPEASRVCNGRWSSPAAGRSSQIPNQPTRSTSCRPPVRAELMQQATI